MESYSYILYIIGGIVILTAGITVNIMLKREGNDRRDLASKLKSRKIKRLSLSKSIKQIQWQEKYAVDNGIIDKDHRILFGLINRFNMNVPKFTSPRQVMPFMHSLKQYTEKHFEREEKLQKAAGYAFCEDHKAKHAALIADLDMIARKAQNANEDTINDIASEAGKFCYDWLISHVLDEDLGMRPYVARMRDKADIMRPLRPATRENSKKIPEKVHDF
jgi:hemerythrin